MHGPDLPLFLIGCGPSTPDASPQTMGFKA